MGFRCALPCFPCAALLFLVLSVGCGGSPSPSTGGSGSTTSGLASGGAASVYVIQDDGIVPATILQFVAGANGAASPTTAATLPVGFFVEGLAVDSLGQLYVGGNAMSGQDEILVYASGTNTPARTILVTDGGPIAVDNAGSVYLAGSGTIYVYSSLATGTATPTRSFTSTSSQLTSGYPINISVDAAGSVYVATTNTAEISGSILVFGAASSGNVTPARTIALNSVPLGVATDGSGNIFVTENNVTPTGPSTAATIAEFPIGSSTPSKAITLTGTTPSEIGGIKVDSVGNVYALMSTPVGSGSTRTNSFSVVSLGPSVTGNTVPTEQLTSPALTAAGTEIAIR